MPHDEAQRISTKGYSPECLERLYEKSSNSDEPPRHEANHRSVHQRFSARTKSLVIFAHPPILVDPSDRPLHYPPTRQYLEASRWHELVEIYLHAFFGPLPGPRLQHLRRSGLASTLDELGIPPQGLLYPICPLAFSAVAPVQPKMGEVRKRSVGVS